MDGEEFIKPVTILPNVIELSYYSNCLIQHFVARSVVATAIAASEVKFGSIKHVELVTNCLELCKILQNEFLFCKPCQNLETTLVCIIDDFVINGTLKVNNNRSECKISRALEEELCSEDVEETEESQVYQLSTDDSNLRNLEYLKNILTPWLESYSISADSLVKLVQNEMVEQDFLKDILEDMKEKFRLGDISYGKLYGNFLLFYVKLLIFFR